LAATHSSGDCSALPDVAVVGAIVLKLAAHCHQLQLSILVELL
jgi:hypothetical protein